MGNGMQQRSLTGVEPIYAVSKHKSDPVTKHCCNYSQDVISGLSIINPSE